MDREIVWTLRATADLESIVEYIFRDSEFYATAVARELVAAARSLTTFAERGRMVAEYEDPSVREIIVRHYRLIYRVNQSASKSCELFMGSTDASDRINRLTNGLSQLVSLLACARELRPLTLCGYMGFDVCNIPLRIAILNTPD